MRPRDIVLGVSLAAVLVGCEAGPGEHVEAQPPPVTTVVNPREGRVRDVARGLPSHVQVDYVYPPGQSQETEAIIDPEKLQPISPEVRKKLTDASVQIVGKNTLEPGAVNKGSGFLVVDKNSSVKLISAGHVFMDMDLDTIEITANDGRGIHLNGGAFSYIEDVEDLAVWDIHESEDFRSIALETRDLSENDLEFGEHLVTANFQMAHKPGSAAVYSLVYISNKKGPFIRVASGIMPAQEDDDLMPGGSGGVVADTVKGQVIGFATNSDFIERIKAGTGCETPFTEEQVTFLKRKKVKADVIFRQAGGLCVKDEIPSIGKVRTVNHSGRFEFVGG